MLHVYVTFVIKNDRRISSSSFTPIHNNGDGKRNEDLQLTTAKKDPTSAYSDSVARDNWNINDHSFFATTADDDGRKDNYGEAKALPEKKDLASLTSDDGDQSSFDTDRSSRSSSVTSGSSSGYSKASSSYISKESDMTWR